MSLPDPARSYYARVQTVARMLYSVTNTIAWPTFLLVVVMIAMLLFDVVPRAYGVEFVKLTIVVGGIFVFSVAIQTIAVLNDLFSSLVLRVAGDSE